MAGVTYLFCILNLNGTLARLADLIVGAAGRRRWLLPVAMYVMGAVLSAAGPGSIPILAIIPVIAVPVAFSAGMVIDGAFRDIEGCREAGFPIYARAVVCGALKKSDYGALKGPVCCGGVPVEQGDIICGDENGVVVIKPQEAAGVLERAAAKAKRQAEVRAEVLKTGRPKMF